MTRLPARVLAFSLAIFSFACDGASNSSPGSFSGSASVGDLVLFDLQANPATYTNVSNGTSGSFSYTVNGDGTLSITDLSGAVVAGVLVEDFALVLQMTNTGPDADQPALVFAIQQQEINPLSIASLGKEYNFVQFRTNSGGMEIGHASIDDAGTIDTEAYWPFGEISGSEEGAFSPMGEAPMPSSSFEQHTPYVLRLPDDEEGTYSYIFQSSAGIFLIDTPNGNIICLKEQESAAFSPSWAGNYKAIFFDKSGCSTSGDDELGTVEMGTANLTITESGVISVSENDGTPVMAATQISPFSTASSGGSPLFVGPGKLSNDCKGLFHFRADAGTSSQRDVFVIPLASAVGGGSAIAFCSLRGNDPNDYDYFYGIAIKQ